MLDFHFLAKAQEEHLAKATGIDDESVGFIFNWIKDGIVFEDEAVALLKRKGFTETAARTVYEKFFRWKHFKAAAYDTARRMKR